KHIFLTPELKNAYECTDGLPIDESPLYDPNNTFANRDPRHEYVIRNPVGTDWEGHYNYNFYDVTGVQNRKGIDPSIPGNYAFGYLNDWDFILLRYADILLMYAEAQNEANGPDQSVYDAINEVRTRPSVNMPPVDEVRYATQDQVRDYIRHERFVEFPVEGIRYFDLKRWGIIDEIQNQRSNAAGVPYSFEQKHYKWPFPQQELDANENLAQTTGYSE
ncbi:MAG: RagB/SusD family nutrient uptake outer membrane protein, partial [Fulvivirga sp.]|uniref:RagB/SusD family nutrient uptake outer membrane protein n=1 Tax=Fulvivirga sp. TaxID=1931237 RepID=UPI0032EF2718